MSDSLRALSFNPQPSDHPWLPEGAAGFISWSSDPDVAGVFTVAGEKFLFLRLSRTGSYSHYWVGTLPDGEQPQEPIHDDVSLHLWCMEYLRFRDRRNILVEDSAVDEDYYESVSDTVVLADPEPDETAEPYRPRMYAGYALRDLFPPL